MTSASIAVRSAALYPHAAPLAAGVAALTMRPISYLSSAILVAVWVAAAVGIRTIASPTRHAALPVLIAVVALGSAAFIAVRVSVPGFGVQLSALGIASLLLAGVAEEAFFRGYLHSWLRAIGCSTIVTGAVTASLFALIHVPIYGAWVLPIDLAAGAIFAWQRRATGTWVAPAVTHAAANLLQIG